MVLAFWPGLKLRQLASSCPTFYGEPCGAAGTLSGLTSRAKLVSGPVPTSIHKDKTRNWNFLEEKQLE